MTAKTVFPERSSAFSGGNHKLKVKVNWKCKLFLWRMVEKCSLDFHLKADDLPKLTDAVAEKRVHPLVALRKRPKKMYSTSEKDFFANST